MQGFRFDPVKRVARNASRMQACLDQTGSEEGAILVAGGSSAEVSRDVGGENSTGPTLAFRGVTRGCLRQTAMTLARSRPKGRCRRYVERVAVKGAVRFRTAR